MPVLQFQCSDCSSVFEQLSQGYLSCLTCDSKNVKRLLSTYFYPNKNFCPHDKDLDMPTLKKQFSGILSDKSLQCGGCGTDGSPGSCSTKGGGCGSGGCGSCGGGSCKSTSKPDKIVYDIYASKAF